MAGLFNYFMQDLAIDLGTANTLIYDRNLKQIVLNEPSVVAVHVPDYHGRQRRRNLADSVVAVGHEAKLMLGRTPANIQAIRPMRDGVIADFSVTEIMLKHFIGKVQSSRWFMRPRTVISVPCQATQVERRAIRESCLSAGAREVYVLEEPMAVAIGMNLPVSEPVGSMVVDIGGGTTEIGVISLGGLVCSSTIRFAGDMFDSKIRNYVEDKHGIQIGLPTAERIKQLVGTAWAKSEETMMEVRGRDYRGAMRKNVLYSTEICTVLNDSMIEIISAVRSALEDAPPELSVDILERGILLAGGGALLRDIDKRFNEDLKIPIIIAEDPLTCVARGCGKALEQTELLRNVVSSQ